MRKNGSGIYVIVRGLIDESTALATGLISPLAALLYIFPVLVILQPE
jgi:hypothetical protein